MVSIPNFTTKLSCVILDKLPKSYVHLSSAKERYFYLPIHIRNWHIKVTDAQQSVSDIWLLLLLHMKMNEI